MNPNTSAKNHFLFGHYSFSLLDLMLETTCMILVLKSLRRFSKILQGNQREGFICSEI